MGMAASQARYLALTARKTNCEWEGQQINQARTALANQTADYFNQLLNCKVPDCPDTTDYTTTQYSYSDGYNDTVLEQWHQLSNSNKEYNYVVDTYYYDDVYTGSKKKMSNPEVIYKHNVTPSNIEIDTIEKSPKEYIVNGTSYKALSEYQDTKEMQNAIKDLEADGYLKLPDGKVDYTNLYGYKDASNIWHITTKDNLENAKDNTKGLANGYYDLKALGIDYENAATWDTDYINNTVTPALQEKGLNINENDILTAIQNGAFDTGYIKVDSTTTAEGETTTFLTAVDETEAYPDGKGTGLEVYQTSYDPTYVGNCKLTELKAPLSKCDETALLQIIADLPDSTISDYITRKPDGTFEYYGAGIYSFEYNGATRYTTFKDLINSSTTYDEYGKPIEGQDKLQYYDATYIKTKIRDKQHAMIETDGSGRFVSLKLEDDSVVYNLHCEQVTDEETYQNAMNQYYHDVQQYEKLVADINAKTEIIQQEDRTLELRLKQLDTEQNALQTEMEAVKKVISKNVETTFKTFSGG